MVISHASAVPSIRCSRTQWAHTNTHSLSLSVSLWRSSQASIPQHRKIPWPDGPGPRPDSPLAPGVNQALSCFLPLVFLLCSILRPVLVRIRLRNPCLRMRISRDGRFMFMYRRGPQRICEPTPASAGFDVIAVLGTTSAVAPPSAAVSAAAAVADGVKALGMRRPAAGLRAKMLGDAAMLGRRVGREEKDLVGNAVRQSEIPILSRDRNTSGEPCHGGLSCDISDGCAERRLRKEPRHCHSAPMGG